MSYAGLLINTCDAENLVVQDKWSEPTTAIVLGLKCRIEYANRIIRNYKGEEVRSVATVFFLKGVNISETTRLFFDGRWHGIQLITREQNSVALHHVEVAVD